mgnify:FL=1
MDKPVRPGFSACKGCGKEVLWAVDDNGTKHPLDTTPPTYVAIEDAQKKGVFRAVRSMAYVSHFATCPMASTFSKRSKPQEGLL